MNANWNHRRASLTARTRKEASFARVLKDIFSIQTDSHAEISTNAPPASITVNTSVSIHPEAINALVLKDTLKLTTNALVKQ